MRNKATIYIAGKIIGEPYKTTYNKFSRAQYVFERIGYNVINPMLINRPHWSWYRCMAKCIFHIIFKADIIFMFRDWEQSKDAKIEHKIAVIFNKEVIHQTPEMLC
jgi:hypothetical protein